MGNLCCSTWLIKHFFKQRVGYQISNLLHKVVDDTICIDTDERRLTQLKNQMCMVRRLSDEWHNITNMSIASGCDPCIIIKNILEMMPENAESLKIGNVLCICTYVTDVCSVLLLRNEPVDACKIIISTSVEYMLDKNLVTCMKFLCFLDDI